MRLLRTIAVTFALYSRIPMPHFKWNSEDMTYSMSVFPWVGAVIGLIYYAVYYAGTELELPLTAVCLLMTAIPLIVTGGFHVDGFLDVSDAMNSYGSKEDKLRILTDPHIGAFAVIRLAICGLIYIAATAVVVNSDNSGALVIIPASGFFMARGLSALGVVTMKSAKKEGMLFYEASTAGKGRTANLIMSIIWILAAGAFMISFDLIAGAFTVIAALLCFAWYRYRSYKELGGITGDTAGWFVTVCETAMVCACAAAAVLSWWLKWS